MIGGMSKAAPTEQHPENGYNTPKWLVDRIREDVFGGEIGLDPCTTPDNPLGATNFIAPPDDGILVPWRCFPPGTIFINPPYGRTIKHWVEKALCHGHFSIVLLVPARTCSAWFHDLLDNSTEMLLFRGRIKFTNGDNAPFPSALFSLCCSLEGVADLGRRIILGGRNAAAP